ncbi:uncharacterized protein LOC144099435 isoform X1 [Amblyomma americanum]
MQPVGVLRLPLLLNELPEQRLSGADARIQRCAPPKQKLNAVAEKTRDCAPPKQKLIAVAADKTRPFAPPKQRRSAAAEQTLLFARPRPKPDAKQGSQSIHKHIDHGTKRLYWKHHAHLKYYRLKKYHLKYQNELHHYCVPP